MIVPAILSDSLQEVSQQFSRVKNESTLTRVQVDIIDPEFVDNVTIYPIDLLEVNLQGLAIDIHLMTNDPINDVVECSEVPGIQTIIAQIERMPSQTAFYEHVNSYGIGCGVSLDLYTPVEELDQSLLSKLSVVQVMGNKAGHQGESFVGQPVLEKIQTLSKLKLEGSYGFTIAVDIGMTPETVSQCKALGAEMFMVGSMLWKSDNLQAAIDQFPSNR